MSEQLSDAEESLGERLIAAGKLSRADLSRARRLCAEGRGRLPAVLAHLGLVREADIASALAEETNLPVLSEADFPSVAVSQERLRGRFLKRGRILPIEEDAAHIRVAMADPLDKRTLQAVQMAYDKTVTVVVAEATLIDQAIDRIYFADHAKSGSSGLTIEFEADLDDDIERLKGLASEAPVIRLVNGLIDEAVSLEASDIHIEPNEAKLDVRFRCDGRLLERAPEPIELAPAIISRIKIMARLDIAERRLPQDGRVQAVVRGRTVDLRISTMPTLLGESAVIRILDRDSVKLEFTALGITDRNRAELETVLKQPNGIALVTGPTGSGKTTTLYAGLSFLNDPEVNILTVEDPVEYRLQGVKQIQVKPSIGLDFARVLRSMLRHDPDIILVGEIRDRDTAEIAIQAALTGHLVLSTLHTNDAVSSITRLLDMGVESYLLASSITAMIAQRLVRKLCPQCREPTRISPAVATQLKLPDRFQRDGMRVFSACGCDACHQSGYRGRTSIMEIARMSPGMRELILRQADSATLYRAACEDGMQPIFEDGLAKVVEGTTTLEEVLRVTQDVRSEGRGPASTTPAMLAEDA